MFLFLSNFSGLDVLKMFLIRLVSVLKNLKWVKILNTFSVIFWNLKLRLFLIFLYLGQISALCSYKIVLIKKCLSICFPFHRRGSVIANFTIRYWEISSVQVVLMQHAIEEEKFINDMPLQKINITTEQGESSLNLHIFTDCQRLFWENNSLFVFVSFMSFWMFCCVFILYVRICLWCNVLCCLS